MKKIVYILLATITLISCGKYKAFDNKAIIENTYSGTVNVTSTNDDPAADFTGNGDNGIYSFAWVNSSNKASVNFDITSNTGSVEVKVYDRKGDLVLNQKINGGEDEDTFSGVTTEGKSGTWKVQFIFTDFNGDGSYSLHPND